MSESVNPTDTPFGVSSLLYLIPKYISEILNVILQSCEQLDDFQLKVLRIFFTVLCVNLFCIWLSWQKYGEKITDRFMKPAAGKSFEDLKREATELKLPTEYTPRL